MLVDNETRQLLARWHGLLQPDALQRVKSMVLTLRITGLAIVILVVLAIATGANVYLIAVGAAAAGWIIAETNALRTRIDQWPAFQKYLDWKLIEQDLKGN